MIVYMIHGGKLVEACLPELKLGGGFMLDKIVEKKVIGIKQCLKFIKLGKGKVLYVAKDANAKLILPIIQLAKEKNIKIVEVSTMKELGKIGGIDVKSSAILTLE